MHGEISSEKGSLLPQFSYYTFAKLIRFCHTFSMGFSIFEVTALDMMNFEWSYIFPRSRTNLPFVVCFIFLGDIGETKLIRGATLKYHIPG